LRADLRPAFISSARAFNNRSDQCINQSDQNSIVEHITNIFIVAGNYFTLPGKMFPHKTIN